MRGESDLVQPRSAMIALLISRGARLDHAGVEGAISGSLESELIDALPGSDEIDEASRSVLAAFSGRG